MSAATLDVGVERIWKHLVEVSLAAVLSYVVCNCFITLRRSNNLELHLGEVSGRPAFSPLTSFSTCKQ